MASNTERTFGAILYNAEQINTIVGGFDDYEPPNPLGALAPFGTLIGAIHTNNNQIIAKRAAYKHAVETRQELYSKTPESLDKRLSPLGSYIRAKYGKDSSEYLTVNGFIKDIRGVLSPNVARSETGEFVSQSHQSFGSKTENLDNIIAFVSSLEGEYTPTNELITVDSLTTLSTTMHSAAAAVTSAWADLKPLLDDRLEQYEQLNERGQKIKESVKAQYGNDSSEYELIKGYKI